MGNPRNSHQVGELDDDDEEQRLEYEALMAASSPRMSLVEETIKPIELLVPVSFMGRPTSTPGLSTWWSTTALSEALF